MDLTELIEQLDEARFMELFEHVLQSAHGLPDGAEPTVRKLDLPGSCLYSVAAFHTGGLRSWASAWCFQITFGLPATSGQETTVAFLLDELRTTLTRLAARPDLLMSLHHPVSVHLDHFGATPEGWSYYLLTNACTEFDENVLDHFAEEAHRLYAVIVGGPRDDHPSFGIATPLTMAERAADLEPFLRKLLSRA